MPRFLRFLPKQVLGIGLICFFAGCQFQPAALTEKKVHGKASLDSGPEVAVRLIRKRVVTQAAIAWATDSVLLLDAKGETIPLPPNTRKVYFKLQAEQVLLAFQKGKAAWKTAKAYSSLTLKTADPRIQIFTVYAPESFLVRDYDARAFRVSVKYGSLAIINVIPLERYVSQVIPEEMDPEHFTLEALKAQAVVARTWALKNLNRHARYGYNFCDGPHCQAYKGRKRLSHRAERAVRETLGEVLKYKDRLAEAFYHSTCGGNTVFVNEVWAGRQIPYLVRVEDHWKYGNRPYCAQSPFARWSIHTSLRRLERVLRQQKKIGADEKLENVQVDIMNRSGRVKRLRLTTQQKTLWLNTNEFRDALEYEFSQRKLLSNFYSVEVEGHQFRVIGHGLGHGVGMCQWGARGMAQHGFSYHDILEHYFKGIQVGKRYGSDKPAAGSPAVTQKSQAEVK